MYAINRVFRFPQLCWLLFAVCCFTTPMACGTKPAHEPSEEQSPPQEPKAAKATGEETAAPSEKSGGESPTPPQEQVAGPESEPSQDASDSLPERDPDEAPDLSTPPENVEAVQEANPKENTPEEAPEPSGPQPPSCNNQGTTCLQTTTVCGQGKCTTKTTQKPKHLCDPKSGLCEQTCTLPKDCGKPTCGMNGSSTCQQTLPQCVAGRCANATKRNVSSATCEALSGFCRYKVDRCQESQDGSLLATAIYPSEPLSTAPSSYKLVKQYQGTSNNGVMFLYTSKSPHTLCHVVFKGVSPTKIQDLVASLTSAKRTNCSSSNSRGMGSCGVGFYGQYQSLRNVKAISDLRSRIELWGCPGGLRIYGHSMGGALSVLLATDLYTIDAVQFNPTMMRVYTYGSPRVYHKNAANGYDGKINVLRWVHDGDPIPSVPPSATDFRHFGDTYEVKRSDGKLKYKKQGQDYSPSISILDPSDSHNYTTYSKRLKDCSL